MYESRESNGLEVHLLGETAEKIGLHVHGDLLRNHSVLLVRFSRVLVDLGDLVELGPLVADCDVLLDLPLNGPPEGPLSLGNVGLETSYFSFQFHLACRQLIELPLLPSQVLGKEVLILAEQLHLLF